MQVLTTWKNTENYYVRAELEAFITFAASKKFDVKKTQPSKLHRVTQAYRHAREMSQSRRIVRQLLNKQLWSLGVKLYYTG